MTPVVYSLDTHARFRYEFAGPQLSPNAADVFAEIPKMHDRLIAIKAARLGAELVTRDRAIQASLPVRCLR